MQCPPSPGPGRKGMKPNGFVAAASITSFTSRAMAWAIRFSSFTSPIFTARKTFS